MTQLYFSEWLIERELREIDGSIDEGWKDWAKYGALAAGGLVAASGVSSTPKNIATRLYNPTAIAQTQQSSVNSIDAFVNTFNQERNSNINKSQVKMIKPSEIIKKKYGDKYDSVLQKAKLSQSPQKIDIGNGETVEMPPDLNSAIMQVGKMDQQVPVVFLKSSEYDQLKMGSTNSGGIGKSAGFCSKMVLNGELISYCVIDQSNNNWEETLAHELSHATQDTLVGNRILASKETFSPKKQAAWNYYFDQAEIGVRLAAFKRDYFKLTGQIVDDNNIGIALKHLVSNKDSYSKDAKDLVGMLNLSIKDNSQKEFFQFLKNNVNSVVKTLGKETGGIYA